MKTAHMEFVSKSFFDSTQNSTQIFPAAETGYDTAATVLLIEDDIATAILIQEAFAGPEGRPFRVDWVTQFSAAREQLREEHVDVVLLELELRDSERQDALDQVLRLAPDAVVLVLCDADEVESARLAVQRGAHEYLVKNHIDVYWWPRVLQYVINSRFAQDELFEERERALVTLNSIGDAVLATDLAGNLTYLNLTAESLTGWSRHDALGKPFTEVVRIIDGTTNQLVVNPAQRAIEEDKTVVLGVDCVLIHRNGTKSAIEDSTAPIHSREGRVSGAVIVFHDVSQSRATVAKMAHLAQHDFLTGLPNRALLTERLLQSIALAHRHGSQVALLFIDLDYFKQINDSLGHGIGDLLLQSAAGRLAACVRTSDTVCRLGGDEFVILLAEIEQLEDAARVAEKLLAAFVAPHAISGQQLHLTISIGISVYPDDSLDADTLTQNADAAMYHAKVNGRNNYQFFIPEMNARAVQRLFVKNNLHRAINNNELLLHYQSQIDLVTGEVVGVEALIRWQDPNFGLVQPVRFVPVAEESGLIVPMGRWVLREACGQVRTWLQQGLNVVPVSVNISALEFRQKGFLNEVALILRETDLPARYLELELTESVLMQDADSSVAVLKALKGMGVRLAIDDFGTGYSSLSYLKRFPIDTLKIDQSFVRNITSDADDATIVSAVIAMAKNLGLRVIAEGVETSEQLAFLQSRHCEQGQGFVFSHPLPAVEFASLLPAGGLP